MNDCIFCQIINKEIPKELTFESDNLVVFPDISPSADIHLLIVPKAHIRGMAQVSEENGKLLTDIFAVINKLVKDNQLEGEAYRVVVNGGRAQHVPHLHFHLLGGQWKKMV